MEKGRLYGHFAGYFREGLDFYNERGDRQFMSRNDYLGGTVLLPIENELDYRKLPDPGTLLRAVTLLIPDSKTGELKTTVQTILYDGDEGFKMPTDQELMMGYRFQGNIFVTKKQSGIRDDRIYRNVIIALFGGSYKLSFPEDEKTFNLFPESGLTTITGKVDTIINSYQRENQWRQKCENKLLLEVIRQYMDDQTQAKMPPSKGAAA